jgi:hypothetical protein
VGYINSNQMDFSVTVFAGFGGTHVDNLFQKCQRTDSHANRKDFPTYLTRTTFNKNIPVLTKRRTLLRKTIISSAFIHKQMEEGGRKILRGNKFPPKQAHRVNDEGKFVFGKRYLKDAPAEAEEKSCS